MLEKVKEAIKKIKPEKKKQQFNNMDDLQSGVGLNTKKEVKSEVKSETKSSLTFGK